MNSRFSQFRCKEVINVNDGCRLGYVSDIVIDTSCGRTEAIIIPGPAKFFGLLGSSDEYCIMWECICRIGEDIILIDADLSKAKIKKPKKKLF
ncbi:MAG: YlmC/YmxH family sporulation protein [Oscillospiraceae bacterium]|nr:YlmC/YmxH family sporulation protein [Oscillospiraceae bacterium]